MRWDELFEDLESQLAFEAQAALEVDVAEFTRGQWAEISMADRLRASIGKPLRVGVGTAGIQHFDLKTVGPEVLGGLDHNGALLIVLQAVTSVETILQGARQPTSKLRQGPSLRSVLRTLARRRAAVSLIGYTGALLAEGTIDRVGSDYLEMALHPRDELRRRNEIIGSRMIPFSAVAMIRSRASVITQ